MRRIDAEAAVVLLACHTEDRDSSEQRALIDTAYRIDVERAKLTVTNEHPVAPFLVGVVMDTYDPSEGRRVGPTKTQRDGLAAATERFDAGYPSEQRP